MTSRKLNSICLNIILDVIDSTSPIKTSKTGRKQKQSNADYLNDIYYVLRNGCAWSELKSHVTGDAVRKKYIYWISLNVFHISWFIIMKLYQHFDNQFQDLYLDASHIKNIRGIQDIGINHYDRYRNGTKLSIITDSKGIPINFTLCKSNRHDITQIDTLLQNVKVDMRFTENLIADKGYASADKRLQIFNKYAINLITPPKKKRSKNVKNVKNIKKANKANKVKKGKKGKKVKKVIKNKKAKVKQPEKEKVEEQILTKKEIGKLKNRYVVERTFAWLKCYKRIRNRYDHKLENFENFILLAMIDLVSNRIK